jgi:hypothetical protein
MTEQINKTTLEESAKAVEKQKPAHLWKPGESGNPTGKKKGTRHFSTLIREAITKVATDTGTSDDKEIVRALVEKAKAGDLKAVDMVLDRVDGKAEETINLDGEMTINDGLSLEEKEALLALLK